MWNAIKKGRSRPVLSQFWWKEQYNRKHWWKSIKNKEVMKVRSFAIFHGHKNTAFGSGAMVQLFKLCACPLNLPYLHLVKQHMRRGLGDQHWTTCLCAADSLIMKVFLERTLKIDNTTAWIHWLMMEKPLKKFYNFSRMITKVLNLLKTIERFHVTSCCPPTWPLL